MSSHPTYLPTKAYFYATGNTPAVDLLDSIPPQDDGRVLILGCGDPRNILHSVYTRGDPGKETSSLLLNHSLINRWEGDRRLDVTCCDIEPAVIGTRFDLIFTVSQSAHSYRSTECSAVDSDHRAGSQLGEHFATNMGSLLPSVSGQDYSRPRRFPVPKAGRSLS